MSRTDELTFVVAVNDADVLAKNFALSPCIDQDRDQVLYQRGFRSAASAYNDALGKSIKDLVVFAHQDVYLPLGWRADLQHALEQLDSMDPNWGVLGCYGATTDGQYKGFLYASAKGLHGRAFDAPTPVQTLDEILLIVRRQSGLRFDPLLPHFHMYGADICLRAAYHGMKSYAISAPCLHNTNQDWDLPKQFWECCAHVRRVYRSQLPINTTCVRLTRNSSATYVRRIKDAYLKYVRGVGVKELRRPTPSSCGVSSSPC